MIDGLGDSGRLVPAGLRIAATSALVAGLLVAALLRVPGPELSLPFSEHGGEVGVERAYGHLPLAFEPNAGRTDPRVDYIARSASGAAFLTGSGAALALRNGERSETVGLRLLGASDTRPSALEPLPGVVNDLHGDDPSRWRTAIPTFERVRYPGVYPGVDLDWYGNERRLEYAFRIAPGASPDGIAMRIDGADRLRLARGGDLMIEAGGITVRHRAPVAYQPGAEVERRPVRAGFQLSGDTVGFRLGRYDEARPLVIDPVILAYSTYLGGEGADEGNGIAVDSSGAAYLTGQTSSTDFNTTEDRRIEGDEAFSDAFVSKLTPAGDALAYSTYLGGNDDDWGSGIAVDSSGAAYVVGTTASTDFNTVGQIRADGDARATDAFIAKLTPDGDALAYSTYLGASGSARQDSSGTADEGVAIAVDSAGAAYVTGNTDARSFFVKNEIEDCTSEFEPMARPGGNFDSTEISDAFVAKLTPAGGALEYSTCLGGDQGDGGTGIAVDASGAAYVAGATSSPDFNITEGRRIEGDSPDSGYDAFVSKLTLTGSELELAYSTYLGGSDFDAAHGIDVDSTGAAYVTGKTFSPDFDTVGQVEGDSAGPDAFVSKLTPAGNALDYSTYLGGSGADASNAIAVDSSGFAHVTGQTDSTDFDLAGEIEGDSASTDAFVSSLTPDGGALRCSTYLGGDGPDSGNGIALDSSGAAYVTGATDSTDFNNAGGIEGDAASTDAFASKLSFTSPCEPSPQVATASAPAADRALRVYVIVLDGLRPQEVKPELTPNLHELKEGGTWYEQARSVFIAETLPNHAAMMTGVLPGRNGIIANDFGRWTGPNAFNKFRMHDPRLLESDTLTTSLEESCDVSTATVQSKIYLWSLFGGDPPNPSDPNPQRQADYHWYPASSPLYIAEPDDHAPDTATMNSGFLPWLEEEKPTPHFAFVNLGDIDRAGHVDQGAAFTSGGLTAFRQAALTDTDTQVGLLVDKLKETHAWDETVLIFTSDHGFDWGTQDQNMDATSPVPAGPGAGVINGGAAMVYMKNEEDIPAAAQFIAAKPGVEFVATRESVPALGNPTLHQLGMDHPNAGDIVAFAEPGYAERTATGNPIPGNHGHALTQHSTLFVTGGHPVLDEESEIVGGETVYDPPPEGEPFTAANLSPPADGPGNLSIAPTVAALFGLGEPPGGYDGKPLSEAFEPAALQPHTSCGAAPAQSSGGPSPGGPSPGGPSPDGPSREGLSPGGPGGPGATCAGKEATIVATTHRARKGKPLIGTKGRDVIVGSTRKDRILGYGGPDLICGRGGNDLLSGNRGNDKLNGGPGNDRLNGGRGPDSCLGGPGRDIAAPSCARVRGARRP